MTRVSTSVLVILILINGSVGVMESSGLSQDVGAELDTGVGDAMEKSVDAAKDGFNPGTGIGQTLFGLFISAFYFFQAIITGVFAAPQLFMNLGFPAWFVLPVFTPMYIIAMLDLVYVATGRDIS